jgi:ABC-type glycerol-3-phosphate transport system substrate-binding protein
MRDRFPSVKIFPLAVVAAVLAGGAVSCRPIADPAGTVTSAESATPFPPSSATILPTPEAAVSGLTVWLPPAFRSDNDSAAGNILQARITAFEEMNPDFTVTVRIKAASGAGGLRDSLAAAAAAAPGSMPDLIALDQSNLHAAAIKSLIRPIDEYVPASGWDSLFPYARSLATIGDLHYGLPFAGDAIVLAGTQVPFSEPQLWAQTIDWTGPVFLPLGDSRAAFHFFGYFAAGGKPMASMTDVVIDPVPLEKELSWLLSLREHSLLAERSLQLDSFESSLQAIGTYGESAVTLFSIVSRSNDLYVTYLPTPEGKRFSLATAWAWAVSALDPARAAKAAELMLWLSDPNFLAEWSRAQGVFPTERAAVDLWPPDVTRVLANGISEEALMFPDDEVTAFVGPVLAKAARRVLIDGWTPADAAQEAAKAIRP